MELNGVIYRVYKSVHHLYTDAVARDETQWHWSKEAIVERRNGIKGKGVRLNSVEQDETASGQTLDLLIGVRIPASQPLLSKVYGSR
jgi:hypothetical protein